MSFTSALPANTPKYSVVVVVPTILISTDTASGVDSTSLTYRELYDYGVGVDLHRVKHVLGDLSTGLDMSRLSVRAVDSGITGELIQYTSRMIFDRGVCTDSILRFLRQLTDRGIHKEYTIPMVGEVLPDPESVVKRCIDVIDTYYKEVSYGYEVRTTHYTIVDDCVLYILSLISFNLCRLAMIGKLLSDDIYTQLSRCWRLATSYRRPKVLDIILPEHENELADMLKCTEELLSKLPPSLVWGVTDLGITKELSRYIDVTGVSDRLIYKSRPIEYFTEQLSPPGGYVLTPPPPYKEALVVTIYGIRAFIFNTSTGAQIWWEDVWQGRPCTQISIYADGWTVAWFEDLCFYRSPDWDYNDSAVAFRVERLDGVDHIHFVVLEQHHSDGNTDCITHPLGDGRTMTCSPNLGPYSGPVRVAYETWIRLGM